MAQVTKFKLGEGYKKLPAVDQGSDIKVAPGDEDAAQRRLQQMLEQSRLTKQAPQMTQTLGGGTVNLSTMPGYQGPVQNIPEGVAPGETYKVDSDTTAEMRKQMQDAELSRVQREIDLARGRERGLQDFSEGSLGRVGEDVSSDIQKLQQMRMGIATDGFGAQAFQGAREQRLDALRDLEQQQLRQLKGIQGQTGVYGGLAGAQRLELMGEQQSKRQDAERDLFLDEVRQKQEAIGAAESTTRATEQDVLGRQQYNIQQRKAELMGLLTAQYGEAALGVTERTSARATQAAKDYAEAVRNQGGGKK